MGQPREDFRQAMALTLTKTATATLTDREVLEYGMIVANSTSAVALTLPAAHAGLKGVVCLCGGGNTGDLTIVDPDGFGGGGAATVTLAAQGDGAVIWCTGTEWFNANLGTAS